MGPNGREPYNGETQTTRYAVIDGNFEIPSRTCAVGLSTLLPTPI